MSLRRLDSDGDMCFGHGSGDQIDGDEAVAQRLSTRIRMRMGEWFLDQLEGLPWFGQPEGQNLLGERLSRNSIQSAITTCVLETEGVAQLISLSLTADHSTRTGTVSLTVLSDTDSTISLEVSLP